MGIEQFQDIIQQKANELYRDMPWREDTRPYYVLVSELMLQQTQVARVVPKFEAFIDAFPSEKELASASLANVLIHWQGLGYNRRAKFLHEAAKDIVARGTFPDTREDLLKLPGVGKNTAGAILAYSFNQPCIFIETNIRTVYIHHFFNDQFDIDDKQITELLEQTIDHEHPREFYWALMDYGSWLKGNGVRNISSSKHYKKQSPLAGSLREMRGMIIRNLSNNTEVEQLKVDARFEQALKDLEREGMINSDSGIIKLTK
jgi:A/G-specific adenine glycosylase